MWRWILGVVGFILVALIATCFAGYRKLTGGGDTVVATVQGDPTKTFALLTDRDSIVAWMPEGTVVLPDGHGVLRAGDTIRVAAPSRPAAPGARAAEIWIVRDAKQTNVLAVEAIQFDPGGLPHTAYTRRDSLVAAGDSTRIVSTFVVMPMFTGSESGAPPGGTVSGSLLGAADRMRLGAARLMWREHLRRLGRHAAS